MAEDRSQSAHLQEAGEARGRVGTSRELSTVAVGFAWVVNVQVWGWAGGVDRHAVASSSVTLGNNF